MEETVGDEVALLEERFNRLNAKARTLETRIVVEDDEFARSEYQYVMAVLREMLATREQTVLSRGEEH